jgi:hypothetical protein
MTNVLELERRVELLTMQVSELSRRVAQPEWVSLSAFAAASGLSTTQVRRLVKKAVKNPADSPLKNGRHYLSIDGGNIQISPVLFRQAIGMASNG